MQHHCLYVFEACRPKLIYVYYNKVPVLSYYPVWNPPTAMYMGICLQSTVEPGYNDMGFYDTSIIASDILKFQLSRHC
jgi:hypothetical protein